MPFSRNPNTGSIESYTENGFYLGLVSSMGDFINESAANDGGPGSGNWGHRGRPGLVGGSGPGGGSQYRGGRSDIAYISSKKDWLNGLTGERQKEAQKFLKPEYWKDVVKQKIDVKKKLDKWREEGVITSKEYEDTIKEKELGGVHEDMSPEEAIARYAIPPIKNNLAAYVGEARNWKDKKDRLIKENLNEEEQKTINWIIENVDDFNQQPDYVNDVYARLKLKACGIPTGEYTIPDEMLYLAGIKQRPTTFSEKLKLDWYKPAHERGFRNGRMIEYYMYQITEPDVTNRTKNTTKLTKEEFVNMCQDFADRLAYTPLKSSELDTARYALNEMENAIGRDIQKEDLDSLSDEDRKTLAEANKLFGAGDTTDGQTGITPEQFRSIMNGISWSPLRKKAERELAQNVLVIKQKMLIGIEPNPKDKSEAYKKYLQKKEEEKREKEELKKKQEAIEKRAKEIEKEDDEIYDKGVQHNDPMYAFEKDENLNRQHLNDVINGCNPYYTESNGKRDHMYTWNCQRCVMAFVARLRGYKVEAKPRRHTLGTRDPIFLNGGLPKIFDGAVEEHVEGRTGDDQRETVEKKLKEWGDGSIGLVSVAWAGRNSAHIFVAMNDNGVIKYIDPQNPSANPDKNLKTGEIQPWYTKMMRVDDKPFTNWVHQAVRPVGRMYYDNANG